MTEKIVVPMSGSLLAPKFIGRWVERLRFMRHTLLEIVEKHEEQANLIRGYYGQATIPTVCVGSGRLSTLNVSPRFGGTVFGLDPKDRRAIMLYFQHSGGAIGRVPVADTAIIRAILRSLQDVKKKYDPTNLFRLNANIKV